MLKSDLEKDLQSILKDLSLEVSDVLLSIPKKSEFGDYTTNIALQLANQKSILGKQNPVDIANKIIKAVEKNSTMTEYLEKIEVIPPGYINFYFKAEKLLDRVKQACDYSLFVSPGSFKITPATNLLKILLEYAQPNTHKAFHIGHTRNITLGESLARLLEVCGHTMYRCTYGSDIGLPVAKAIWGVGQLTAEYKQAKKATPMEQAQFLGKAYAKGAAGYEEEEEIKNEIDDLNRSIYLKQPQVMAIWEETRNWSLNYLSLIYQQLGTKFDNIYSESQVSERGRKIVEENMTIFKSDQGSVIFPGVEYGLHNRVFISSQGNPTYEAKELGLAEKQYSDFKYDRSYHLVASEQAGYFQVVFKVIDLLFPDIAGKKIHISYEYVDLKGRKMSSRLGDVVTFDELLDEVRKKVSKLMKLDTEDRDKTIDIISIGAIKFMMLQYSPQTKIYFDLEKSVSLEGDSGPYIQYTYARAKSVLRAAQYDYKPDLDIIDVNKAERDILQKIEHFPVLVKEAADNLNPTILANFLLELSRLFNLFYQQNQIIKSTDRSGMRLAITCAVASTIAQGLYLLGIEVTERM